jgi:hypothetical protein
VKLRRDRLFVPGPQKLGIELTIFDNLRGAEVVAMEAVVREDDERGAGPANSINRPSIRSSKQ